MQVDKAVLQQLKAAVADVNRLSNALGLFGEQEPAETVVKHDEAVEKHDPEQGDTLVTSTLRLESNTGTQPRENDVSDTDEKSPPPPAKKVRSLREYRDHCEQVEEWNRACNEHYENKKKHQTQKSSSTKQTAVESSVKKTTVKSTVKKTVKKASKRSSKKSVKKTTVRTLNRSRPSDHVFQIYPGIGCFPFRQEGKKVWKLYRLGGQTVGFAKCEDCISEYIRDVNSAAILVDYSQYTWDIDNAFQNEYNGASPNAFENERFRD